jgi:glucose-1-phosphate thymidylyltransferase
VCQRIAFRPSRNCLRNTLIRADFDLDPQAAVIWVKQVDQPEAYGVVKLNDANEIVELVEKPQDFVSDLAVIGIYYFKEVGDLKQELQNVLTTTLKWWSTKLMMGLKQ